jgi:succinyl-diaminopimelate desuccinylase
MMKTLLKQLIQADSTPEKGELAAARVISASFRQSGIESHVDTWSQNRANIVAHLKSSGRKAGLLFACHLDVVPPGEAAWTYPVFGAVEADGKVYGRGTTDMKGGTAAVVTAIRRIVDAGVELHGDLIFAATAGEETDSCGAQRFVDRARQLPELAPKGLAGVVIPEPTDFALVTAHRGMLWLEVTTVGKAAHSSTPHLGVNAIESMRRILNELDNYEIMVEPHELLGDCSMSVNTIEGGKAMNVVPDKCRLGIDFRTLPSQDHRRVIADLERILAKLKSVDSQFNAAVSVLRQVQPLETDRRCDFVKALCRAVGAEKTTPIGYTTDGPYFASLGAPLVIFGPGKPALCHKPDEYIEVADLEKAAEHYRNIILKFLA